MSTWRGVGRLGSLCCGECRIPSNGLLQFSYLLHLQPLSFSDSLKLLTLLFSIHEGGHGQTVVWEWHLAHPTLVLLMTGGGLVRLVLEVCLRGGRKDELVIEYCCKKTQKCFNNSSNHSNLPVELVF